LDVDINDDLYIHFIEKMANNNEISIEVIDNAVLRLLYLKYYLGLFDNPYCDESDEAILLLNEKHLEEARITAQKASVLLKNDGALPLSKDIKVAVIGPLADTGDAYLGWWRGFGKPDEAVSILTGIINKIGEENISFSQGLKGKNGKIRDYGLMDHIEGKTSTNNDEIEDLVIDRESVIKAIESADVIIGVFGETSHKSGEAHCRSDLDLPGAQNELLDILKESGKPVVSILIAGRPLSAVNAHIKSNAVLMMWQPGTEGGNAAADLLFGDVNPSGKLCFSIPLSSAHIPSNYSCFNTGRPFKNSAALEIMDIDYISEYCHGNDDVSRYLDSQHDPLYPFGYGLSYTTFEYSDIKVSSKEIKPGDLLEASVCIKNTGKIAGYEVAQLYVQDVSACIIRPVRELKGFARVFLNPGEEKQVKIPLKAEQLKFHDFDNNYINEPGIYRIFIGGDSNAELSESFTLTE
jgi:beta-glucosidase